MRVQVTGVVIGAVRIHGTGKESKKPYEMFKVLLLNPAKNFAGGDFNRDVTGQECVEVDCEQSVYEKSKTIALPATLIVDMDQEVRGAKLQPVVVGLSAVPK